MRRDTEIDEIYRARSERYARDGERAGARSRRLSHARLVAFLAALLPFLVPLPPGGRVDLLRIGAAGLILAVYVALVLGHHKVDRLRRWYDELRNINDEARKRLARDWDELPSSDSLTPDHDHPYAEDLDIFGHASLLKLLGAAGTPLGRRTLKEWLLEPAGPGVIRERQAAVADLAQRLELREELAARGRLMADARPEGLEGFLSWAEGEPWLERRRWLIWTAYVLPLLTLAFIVLHAAGVLTYHSWAIAVIVSVTLTFTVGKNADEIFERVFARESKFQEYSELFRLISGARFTSPMLSDIQADLTAGGLSAHRQMARLHQIGQLADARLSMLHLPLQALLLWNLHVLLGLERWQRTVRRSARRWLSAIGEVDALAALAGLRHDNPDWAVPEFVDDAAPVVEARELGHPLLSRSGRVVNDVQIGPSRTFLLVTGSNMSGKSTLLRAIGTNVVLAQAGGPVCASSMRLPAVTLRTDMRVHDSLEHGISHFMAELERLKSVVAAAHQIHEDGRRILLYLLDDILQGTNTAERQIAARRVIRHLLATTAIGAVTTHDLALADTEELSSACRPVHFTETLHDGADGPILTFDYRLRPGIATSRNALKLLEIVGLDPSGSDEAK